MKPARRGRPGIWWGAALLGAALLLAGWGYTLTLPPNIHSRVYRYIRVTPGSTADAIAVTLQRQGIIRSGLAFRILSRWEGLSTRLKAGVYRLSPHDSLTDVLNRIRSGDVVVIKVTIPEGFTVREIVARLVAHHIGQAGQYQSLEHRPLPGMPKPAPGVRDALEGYLFPATYSFPWGTTPRQAVALMWQTFQKRAYALYRTAKHPSLSFSEWVTLASIVQAEDHDVQDAPKVAAVFINRLHRGMPFQSDATVRYALDHRVSGGLTLKDLAVDSPYNTYQHKGLPPGPISNPGLAMLRAALYPAHVPYLYFLSLRNGKIVFATTYQEQLAHIAQANAHP